MYSTFGSGQMNNVCWKQYTAHACAGEDWMMKSWTLQGPGATAQRDVATRDGTTKRAAIATGSVLMTILVTG